MREAQAIVIPTLMAFLLTLVAEPNEERNVYYDWLFVR
jgi:hypothetical protein